MNKNKAKVYALRFNVKRYKNNKNIVDLGNCVAIQNPRGNKRREIYEKNYLLF